MYHGPFGVTTKVFTLQDPDTQLLYYDLTALIVKEITFGLEDIQDIIGEDGITGGAGLAFESA